MKIIFDQLAAHLQRGLAPVYLVAGDESLLRQEACDLIQNQAAKSGYDERLQLSVGAGFDWSLLRQAYQSGSIFSEQQYIELELTSTKLNEEGKKTLLQAIEKPNPRKLLLIIAGKLDAATQRSAWVKVIEKLGIWLPIWPLQPNQVMPWIVQRFKKHGLEVETKGIQLLAAYTQGNLWATAQAIENLALLYPSGRISEAQVQEATVASAHYELFDLTDIVLQGNAQLALGALHSLRNEGVEPSLILWALTRELRQLLAIKRLVLQGQSISQALLTQGIWEKRKPIISQAVQKFALEKLYLTLELAGKIDQMIKGASKGKVWDGLLDLSLLLTGVKLCLHL